MNSRERLIRQLAIRRGLDPDAVVAIASVEGNTALHGGVSIGDHGTSFGPFQLHVGGALPAGKGSAWAHSRAGLTYALDRIAGVARGLKGKEAVSAISSRFERPADVPGEIAKAMGYYGKSGGGGGGGRAGGPIPAGGGALGAVGGAVSGLTAESFRSMLAAQMLQQSAATAAGAPPDSSGLVALAMARRQLDAAQQSYGHQPTKGPLVPKGGGAPASGKINELFYDPLGGIKHGKQIGAIGHHTDHVHVALGSLQSQLAAERRARAMGLRVGEEQDSDFHNVHAANSYHNRDFPGTHFRQAADVSGAPQSMAAFYKWIASNYR
jgi:hypothetical protein